MPNTSSSSSGSRSKRDKKSKVENAAAASTGTDNVDAKSNGTGDADMTLGQVFWEHPLIKVGKFLCVPYALYLAYFFFQLQHPDWISKATLGLINLRPAMSIGDERQVLIVASPSTGTVQMQTELKEKLGLEIGHETTDASWHFVRDGAISWFHGIRFFTKPDTNEGKAKSFSTICSAGAEYMNMGFHPAAYRPPVNGCSYRKKWDDCWAKECLMILVQEWGCGIRKDCEINFATNIHQVRNPMRTMESLAVKFCVGGLEGTVADVFLIYASALFPHHNFYEDSCIEATGYFLVEYQNAMIEARKKGLISDFYRIEETSACDVAKMAGLFSSDTTVYPPNYEHSKVLCDENNTESPAQQVVAQKENKVNTGLVKLGWKDLCGGRHGSMKKEGSTDLEKKVRELFKAFGYDESLELEEAPAIETIPAEEL